MTDDIQKNNQKINNLKEESGEKEIVETESEKCQKERDEYLDGWKRAKAELINYKKDEIKRFESVVKFANESLIKELISVLDSFDLALISLGSDGDGKIQKGLYLIHHQLEDAMEQQGLERIIVSVGNPFDPVLQEAIAEVESDKQSGTIIEEIEKGYLLNGKLIRPARVKVSK